MIKFNQVTFRIIELPLVTPFETSSARMIINGYCCWNLSIKMAHKYFRNVAKQIPNYTPETVDTAHVVLKKHILPLVLGQSFDHPTHLVEKIQAHVRGNLMAVASVDMAAWALHATQQGVLSQAIGGTKSKPLSAASRWGFNPRLRPWPVWRKKKRPLGIRRLNVKLSQVKTSLL